MWKHEANGERDSWGEVCLNGQMSWTCEEVADDDRDYNGIANMGIGMLLFTGHCPFNIQ